jgi:hypothetical protein
MENGLIEKVHYGRYQWLDVDNPSKVHLIKAFFMSGFWRSIIW